MLSDIVKNLILAFLLSYAVLAGVTWLMQARLVYLPLQEIESIPSDIGLAYEDVSLKTSDSVIVNGWFITAQNNRGTVLFCHGNAGNISHRLDTIRALNELGLSVMIFDYRGYGRSEGKPSESGSILDAEAALLWLEREKGVKAKDIVIMGRSLGGAVAARLAAENTPRGLILESTFTSIKDLGALLHPWLPVRLLMRYEYPVETLLGDIRCPVLVAHSPGDDIVPFAMGQRLLAAANEPKDFFELKGGHNDGFLLSEKDYKRFLDGWLERLD